MMFGAGGGVAVVMELYCLRRPVITLGWNKGVASLVKRNVHSYLDFLCGFIAVIYIM
jgi:hypothetical protein